MEGGGCGEGGGERDGDAGRGRGRPKRLVRAGVGGICVPCTIANCRIDFIVCLAVGVFSDRIWLMTEKRLGRLGTTAVTSSETKVVKF